MMLLEHQHPDIVMELHKGNFVNHSQEDIFLLWLYQTCYTVYKTHEQNTEILIGDGGAIWLTEDPSTLRRWMVAKPEVSHLVAEYETHVRRM